MFDKFVIVEKSRIDQDLPDKFKKAITALDVAANGVASDRLGLEPGGMNPGGNQFGKTPIRLNYFNLGTTSGTAETWNRNFQNRGWNTFIDNDTMDNTVIAIAGLQLPNVSQRVAAHQWSVAAKDMPVIEHEAEIQTYRDPVIVYERGQVIPPKTTVKLDLLIQGSGGYNMVKPLGWALVPPNILTKKVPK